MLGAMDSMSNTNGIEEMPMMDKPDVVGESPQVSEMGNGLGTQTGASVEVCQAETVNANMPLYPMVYRLEGTKILDLCTKVMALSDEAKVTVSNDGWHVRIVDPAHCAMLDMSIPKTDFWTYEYREMEFGIDVEKVAVYLKSLGKMKKEIVDMKIDWEKNQVVFSSPIGERIVNMIDTTGISEPKIPKIVFQSGITIDSAKSIMSWIKSAETITDHVRLSLDMDVPNCLTLQAYGELDSAKFNLEGYDQLEKPASALYALHYFKALIKALGSEKIRVEYNTDFPVKIQSLVTQTVFLLAPRIETD